MGDICILNFNHTYENQDFYKKKDYKIIDLYDLKNVSRYCDEKTLNILLVHWVNHNQSHEEGFREWVEKAKEMGKDETAQYIEKAIEYMQKANDMLTEAKKHM